MQIISLTWCWSPTVLTPWRQFWRKWNHCLITFLTQVTLGFVKNWALIVFWGKQDDCACITISVIPFHFTHLLLTALGIAFWFNKWKLYGAETRAMSMTITESDFKLITEQETCLVHLRGNRNNCCGNCFSCLDENEMSQICLKGGKLF